MPESGVTNEVPIVIHFAFAFLTDFVSSTLPLIAAMALIMFIELVLPLHRRAPQARRLRVNLMFTVLTLGLYFVLGTALMALLAYSHARGWGMVSLPAGWLSILVTVLVLDFATWFAHWAMHRVPILWRVHLVHHSDVLVDVTTSYRQHPLEGLWRISIIAIAALVVGATPVAYVIYRSLSAINAVLEHANLRVPLWVDRWICPIWVTPNFHKLHHSKEQSETDTNYGNLFSFFDRGFGTFSSPKRAADVSYGIETYEDAARFGFFKTLRIPFAHKKSRPL